MNYYPHHIGDYLKDTAHLTMIEDGAYRRLIDLYYLHEKPFPKEKNKIYRLARASSRLEKNAIDSILDEYFYEENDGFHHKRCDEEISNAGEKIEETDERKSNEKERKRRHRQRRKELFNLLREYDVVPSFDTPIKELEHILSLYEDKKETSNMTSRETGQGRGNHSFEDGTGTANQSQSQSQSQSNTKLIECVDDLQVVGTEKENDTHPYQKPNSKATEIAILMRQYNVRGAQPANPEIIAMADQGVDLETVKAALDDIRESKPNESVSVSYVAKKLQGWAEKARQINVKGAKAPQAKTDNWFSSKEGIERKGRELGLTANVGEDYPSFKARIERAIESKAKEASA